jgi:hypothetical protein
MSKNEEKSQNPQGVQEKAIGIAEAAGSNPAPSTTDSKR